MNETDKTELEEETDIENLPSAPVRTPFVVPFSSTLTPAIGVLLASTTRPVTVLCCKSPDEGELKPEDANARNDPLTISKQQTPDMSMIFLKHLRFKMLCEGFFTINL